MKSNRLTLSALVVTSLALSSAHAQPGDPGAAAAAGIIGGVIGGLLLGPPPPPPYPHPHPPGVILIDPRPPGLPSAIRYPEEPPSHFSHRYRWAPEEPYRDDWYE